MTTLLIQKNRKPWGTRYIFDIKHKPGNGRHFLLPRLIQRSSPGNRVKFLYVLLPLGLSFYYVSFSNSNRIGHEETISRAGAKNGYPQVHTYTANTACVTVSTEGKNGIY